MRWYVAIVACTASPAFADVVEPSGPPAPPPARRPVQVINLAPVQPPPPPPLIEAAPIPTTPLPPDSRELVPPPRPRTGAFSVGVGPAFPMGDSGHVGVAIAVSAGWFATQRLSLQLRFSGFENDTNLYPSSFVGVVEPYVSYWLAAKDWVAGGIGAGFGLPSLAGMSNGLSAGVELRVGHRFQSGVEISAGVARIGLTGFETATALIVEGGFQLF